MFRKIILFCLGAMKYNTKNRVSDVRVKKSIEVLNKIIQDLELNPNQLSEKLGFKRPERLYKILRGQSSISRNLANIINGKYPQYSIDWLLIGEKGYNDELFFEKNGSKIKSFEIIDWIVKNEKELSQRNEYFKLWIKDKALDMMTKKFKEMGYEITYEKIKNKHS